jgi:hypothetical protein
MNRFVSLVLGAFLVLGLMAPDVKACPLVSSAFGVSPFVGGCSSVSVLPTNAALLGFNSGFGFNAGFGVSPFVGGFGVSPFVGGLGFGAGFGATPFIGGGFGSGRFLGRGLGGRVLGRGLLGGRAAFGGRRR